MQIALFVFNVFVTMMTLCHFVTSVIRAVKFEENLLIPSLWLSGNVTILVMQAFMLFK